MDINRKRNKKIVKFQLDSSKMIKAAIAPFFVFIFTIFIFYSLVLSAFGTKDHALVWTIAICVISINAIIPILLHFNYYKNDRNKIMEINREVELIILKEEENTKRIRFRDIKIVNKYYVSKVRSNLKSYYFYRVILKDNSSFSISCYMIEKFEDEVDDIEFDHIFVMYPFIN